MNSMPDTQMLPAGFWALTFGTTFNFVCEINEGTARNCCLHTQKKKQKKIDPCS